MQAVLALFLLGTPSVALNIQSNTIDLNTDAKKKCSCLPWKDVYTKFGVLCGQGYELAHFNRYYFGYSKLDVKGVYTFENDPVYHDQYIEFCQQTFQKLSSAKCLNHRFAPGLNTTQWCYVPATCEGAEKVEGTSAALHNCTENDDLMSKALPEELNAFIGPDEVTSSILGKLSYRINPFRWSLVEKASGLSSEQLLKSHFVEMNIYGLPWHHRNVINKARRKYDEVVASGIPTIFDSDNDIGGTLVMGKKIYAFTANRSYECLTGCDK